MSNVVPFTGHPSQHPSTADRAHNVIDLLPTYIELAGRIANTEFVPKDLRRRPEAVLAALMSGAERGLGPMESLRSIYIIEGRPSLSAEAQRALVLAAGHDIEIVESTAVKATVIGRRAGSDSTSPPFTWTIDRARRARLTNKDNWVKYPEAMLLARASSDLCKAVFPDVIAGLVATEELLDLEPAPTTARRAPARSGRVSAPAPASIAGAEVPVPNEGIGETAAPAPGLLGGIPGADRPSWGPAPVSEPEPSTDHDAGLQRRIHAEITKAFPDADAATRTRFRHALVALVTRRRDTGTVTSSSELDLAEQMQLSEILTYVRAGTVTVVDGPDDTIEIRVNGWLYTITLEPLTIAAAPIPTPAPATEPEPEPTLEDPT